MLLTFIAQDPPFNNHNMVFPSETFWASVENQIVESRKSLLIMAFDNRVAELFFPSGHTQFL